MIPHLIEVLNEHFGEVCKFVCPDRYDDDWEAHEDTQVYFADPGKCPICGQRLAEEILES